MAAYGLPAVGCTNINPSGWASVVTDHVGGANYRDTFSVLMGEGALTQESQAESDQYGRDRSHGFMVKGIWRVPNLNTAADIRNLQAFTNCFHHTNINFVSGDNAVIGNATVGYNGCIKWKFVAQGGASKQRYVEMMVQRFCLNTGASGSYDNDDLWGAVPTEFDTPLFTLGAFASAGIKNFYIRNSGETNYEEMDKVDGSLICELETFVDEGTGCYLPAKTIDIKIDMNLSGTSATMLGVLDSINGTTSNDCKIVFQDDRTFVFADNTGVLLTASNPVKVGEIMKLNLKGNGKILLSDWDSDIITA